MTDHKQASRRWAHLVKLGLAGLSACALLACGGGGGDSLVAVQPVAVAPPPVPGDPTGVTPPPGVVPVLPTVTISASTRAAPNARYAVDAPAGDGAVVLTLPESSALVTGDRVSISGRSATTWQLAQNEGQAIDTTALPGNTAPGTTWRPVPDSLAVWHWMSSDATGQTLLAGEASGGRLHTSVDGGQTWTRGDSVSGTWISSDMTPDGRTMVAVTYGRTGGEGGLYLSRDRGTTWQQVTDPVVNTAAGLPFESVTISANGQVIAAAVQPDASIGQAGLIVISNDGGMTWAAVQTSAAGFNEAYWRSIDSSSDGSVMVAVAHDPSAFISTDAGANWSPLTVATGVLPTPVVDNWYRVRVSADGNTIAMVGNTFGGPRGGTGIYVSRDRGATWSQGIALNADYSALAMSVDGQVIAASVSEPNFGGTTAVTPGRVLLSTNGGLGFAPVPMPSTDTQWRALAMSGDGNRLAAAAGRFALASLPAERGQLYTSLGNRTSFGTAGAITGGQGRSVTVEYLGNGRFSVQEATGTDFSVQ